MILDLPAVPEWTEQALCAQTDPEAFFPDKGGSVRTAKATCRSCPVQSECLDYALEHDERHGIWGGLAPLERAAISERSPGRPRQPISHGTPGGYRTHRRRGETACQACREAHTAYNVEKGRAAS